MQRVVPAQNGYTVTGEYLLDMRSGVMSAGLAGDSEIYQFRWTAPTLCLVTEVSMWAGAIVAFTPGFFNFHLRVARSWTALGTGGDALATLTGNNAKLRTSFPTTALSAARISQGAAISAGTKTFDASSATALGGGVDGTVPGSFLQSTHLLGGGAGRGSPLILAANEGFSVIAFVPLTGTWVFSVSVRWEETGGYRL